MSSNLFYFMEWVFIVMTFPKVSIIIPVKAFNPYLEECLQKCLELDYPAFDIIVLPDGGLDHVPRGVTVVPTGEVGPAVKRDIGVQRAESEIIAFIDDDTYPVREWLSKAVRHFDDPSVGAVGGPAVTPASDCFMRQASGAVFSSLLGGGAARFRYIPLKMKNVDDFPSCNLLVRKSDFLAAAGFNSSFWPGEDTEFCLRLVKDLKKRIVYDPEALIYHHRRKLFRAHIKQVYAYALHRGYFVKRFPQTSRRPAYFLPSIVVSGFIGGVPLSAISPVLRPVILSMLCLYIIMVLLDGMYGKRPVFGLTVFAGILATHFTYGIGFVHGLLSRKLGEEEKQ